MNSPPPAVGANGSKSNPAQSPPKSALALPPDGLSSEDLNRISDDEIQQLVSADAWDLVEHYEVGGRSAYDNKYKRPEWPGGPSSVTIGIGYDIGYASLEDFTRE